MLEAGGEQGDEPGVEPVVLGAPELCGSKGPHLFGLHPHSGNGARPQVLQQAPLIAARSLEADALHLVAGQEGIEFLEPLFGIGHHEVLSPRHDNGIELLFRDIDPGAACVSLVFGHLLDPRLGYEPGCSSNHPGRKKMPMAIQLPYSAKALGR